MTYVLDDGFKSSKKKIEYIIDDECFICTSHAKSPSGCYKVKRNGVNYDLHKWIYLSLNGVIEGSLVIRHTCNNKSCINPSHLILGTKSDNAIDFVKSGDEKNVLSEEVVLDIKKDLKENKLKSYEIAEKYCIKPSHV